MTFVGEVNRGVHRFHKELVVPGAGQTSVPISGWPDHLEPGTLNVRVRRFPDAFLEAFGEESVKPLDTRRFAPEAELHFSEIENNTLAPTKPGDRPDKGNAQIWRASLTVDATGRMRRCWVLRRIGSGIGKSLELVSGERLRSALALEDGDVVFVGMEGTWVP